jgi:Cys-rich protein (TIGR01571 family)
MDESPPDTQKPQAPQIQKNQGTAAQELSEAEQEAIHVADVAVGKESMTRTELVEILLSFATWLFLYCLFGWFYYNFFHLKDFYEPVNQEAKETQKAMGYADFQSFKTGLCQCQHLDISCWSWCCPCIQWAGTHSKLGIQSYLNCVLLMGALTLMSFIPGLNLLAILAIVFCMTFHRQELRKKFKFDQQGGFTYLWDCCCLCFCTCCSLVQEAQHVRAATAVEHPAIDYSIAQDKK